MFIQYVNKTIITWIITPQIIANMSQGCQCDSNALETINCHLKYLLPKKMQNAIGIIKTVALLLCYAEGIMAKRGFSRLLNWLFSQKPNSKLNHWYSTQVSII